MKNYQLDVQEDDGQVRFIVSGSIDSTNAAEFGDIVASERRRRPDGEIVFDCGGLEYISSTGLRVVLLATKTMDRQGEMRIVGSSDSVYDILEIAGFTGLCDVERAAE